MAQLTQFTTRALPPGAQFPAWRDCLQRYFGDVRATARNAARFEAWIESISESGVVVTRMLAGPQQIEHRESAAPAEHRDFVHIVFPLAGRFHVEQAGRSAVLEPGDWGVYDLSRSFRSLTEHPVELLVLATPRAAIPRSDLEQVLAQRFSSRNGSARVVKNFMTSLLEEQRALSPALRHDFATTALRLMRLTLMEHAAPKLHRKSSHALRSQMSTYIANHLRDSDLSLGSIATACQCSKRYVQKLFSKTGQTAARYILQSRLTGSAQDLARPELAHLSITDIAVSWGFKSSSTFSRVFRRHFHLSPRLYRRRRLERFAP